MSDQTAWDLVDGVERQRYRTVRRGPRAILASLKELQAWSTWAVGDAYGASELNKIGNRDPRVTRDELLLECYNLICASISIRPRYFGTYERNLRN